MSQDLAETLDCALCDGKGKLLWEVREMCIHGKNHTVQAPYYKCDTCSEEFTTTESDSHWSEVFFGDGKK